MTETQTKALSDRKAPRTAAQMEADFRKEQAARKWRETKRETLASVKTLADGIRIAESTVDIKDALDAFNADMEGVIPISPAKPTDSAGQ